MSVILCTAGYDHIIRFWEALSGICSRTIPFPDSQVNRLAISQDKKYVAAAGNHKAKMFDVKSSNPNPLVEFEGHTGNITGLAFHCEGKWIVTSSEDGTVKIWDTRNGAVQRSYSHAAPVNDVVIHPNQGELISCDRGGNIRIWDLGENKCTHQMEPEEDKSVASVTVASDGSMLAAGNNAGNVYVWRLLATPSATSLVPICKFSAHDTYVTRVLLSPDVRHLATCSADHTAKIWAVNHGNSGTTFLDLLESPTSPQAPPSPTTTTDTRSRPQQMQAPSLPDPPPPTVPFATPHAGSANSATVYSSPSGPPNPAPEPNAFVLETTLFGHQRWVWDCAFSADSAYLVTACSDHYARLWELSSQQIIRQYNGHHRGAVCVALNDYSEGREGDGGGVENGDGGG